MKVQQNIQVLGAEGKRDVEQLLVVRNPQTKQIVSIYDQENRWFLESENTPHESIKAWLTERGSEHPSFNGAKDVDIENQILPEVYAQDMSGQNALYFDLTKAGKIKSIYEKEADKFVVTPDLYVWLQEWANNASGNSWDLRKWGSDIVDLDTNLPITVRKLIAAGVRKGTPALLGLFSESNPTEMEF